MSSDSSSDEYPPTEYAPTEPATGAEAQGLMLESMADVEALLIHDQTQDPAHRQIAWRIRPRAPSPIPEEGRPSSSSMPAPPPPRRLAQRQHQIDSDSSSEPESEPHTRTAAAEETSAGALPRPEAKFPRYQAYDEAAYANRPLGDRAATRYRYLLAGSNWGGARRKGRHWSSQITRKACIQVAIEADEDTLQNVDERWGVSWHASGAPAVIWSLDHAQLERSNHYATPGVRGGSHGVTAHAVTLSLHRAPEDSKLLGVAGVHINNVMAKQSPTRVLTELQDLEKWLLLMNIDVALVDANQSAFSRDGRPATLGQIFHAPVWQDPLQESCGALPPR